jgi:hypothetical protein
MSNIDLRYEVEEIPDLQLLTYLFISKGPNEIEDVVKIIQYAYVQDFEGKPVFNLGFGDLELETGSISDDTMTGNGDVYRVFNTVLSTIPQFYEKYPEHILLVQGSDGRAEYEAACRTTCTWNCGGNCHNFRRRIKTYCTYVTRKIDVFEPDFQFLGGMRNNDNWFDFEDFIPGKFYDAIMVYQKNV